MTVGGIAGVACLAGVGVLAHRRLFDPRIRATAASADIAHPAVAVGAADARPADHLRSPRTISTATRW